MEPDFYISILAHKWLLKGQTWYATYGNWMKMQEFLYKGQLQAIHPIKRWII